MKRIDLPENQGMPLAYIFLTEQLHEISQLRNTLLHRMYGSFADDVEDVDALKQRVRKIRDLFEEANIEESGLVRACLELEKRCESAKHDLISPGSSGPSRDFYRKGRYIVPFCAEIQEFEHKLRAVAQSSINYSRN